MKKRLLILLIYIAIIFAIYIFVISGAFSLFMSEPEKPEITYGEFPFTITYEVNGEMKKVEDAVVCEYDGIKNLGTAGKYRSWKSKLKSGNERVTLLRIEEESKICEITISPGLPEYYMGDFIQDKTEYEKNMLDDRYLGYIEWKDGKQTGNTIPKEEVYEKYKLKVIEWIFQSQLKTNSNSEQRRAMPNESKKDYNNNINSNLCFTILCSYYVYRSVWWFQFLVACSKT